MTEHCNAFECREEATHHIAIKHHKDNFGQWVFEKPYCLRHTRYAVEHLFEDIVSYHPIHRSPGEDK